MGSISERRKSKTHTSRLCSRGVLVNGLRFFWVITVIWCEAGAFFYSLRGCRWPTIEPFGSHEKPAHVLLVTDTQVQSPSSPSEKSWRRSLRRYIHDLHLKKSWNVATRLKPHSVIFLGDMLAAGKYVTDEAEYVQYYKRFKDKFPLDPDVQVWYLPGNNDVGLGLPRSLSKTIRGHFSHTFGPFNLKVSLKNHTFLLLDAPGLVEEDYQRTSRSKQYEGWDSLPGGAVEFVKRNAVGRNENPLILFSHIPLFRPDTKTCGPFRERGTIRRGVGTGYQNTLGKQTSIFLLENLRPSAIFSGDNRDYCDYTHSVTLSRGELDVKMTVREVTVKSFSMANQIRRPGFQLFSLVSPPLPPAPPAPQTFADTPCLLPDQYGIYTSVYAPCLSLTMFILFLLTLYRLRHLRAAPPTPISLSPHSTRLSNTPLLHPESAIWSPHTPVVSPAHKSVSPRVGSFHSLRTPNAPTAPALRAFSRPSTPHASPLLSPMLVTHDDDDDESMYPAQYAIRRDGQGQSNGNAWIVDHGEDDRDADYGYGRTSSYFLPAPGVDKKRWSWSWSANVRGRRLNATIRLPGLRDLQETFGRPRWHMLRGMLVDMLAVAWPPVIVWVVIALWIF